jgi:hypothetical protein
MRKNDEVLKQNGEGMTQAEPPWPSRAVIPGVLRGFIAFIF